MPRSVTASLWSPSLAACATVMLLGATATLRAQSRDSANLTAAFSGVDKLLGEFASHQFLEVRAAPSSPVVTDTCR